MPTVNWLGQPGVLEEFTNRNNYPVALGEPVVRGRVLVLDMDNKCIAGWEYRLPRELFPASKEEVGTLVWLRRFRTPVARYASGATGYQETLEMTIVDNVAKQAVYTNVFTGGMPEKKVSETAAEAGEAARNGRSGGSPDEAAKRHLLSLPRK